MPKQIYQCIYCGHTLGRYQHENIYKVIQHEKECNYNPSNKRCASCWDFGSKADIHGCCKEVRDGNKCASSTPCEYYKPHERYNTIS